MLPYDWIIIIVPLRAIYFWYSEFKDNDSVYNLKSFTLCLRFKMLEKETGLGHKPLHKKPPNNEKLMFFVSNISVSLFNCSDM